MSAKRMRMLSYEERKRAFRRRAKAMDVCTGILNSVFLGMVILSGVIGKIYFF